MAEYEVYTSQLTQAGNSIQSFADDLNAMRERLDGIVIGLPKNLQILRGQKQISCNLADMSTYAKRVGRTVSDVVDIYTDADRSAFNGEAQTTQRRRPRQAVTPPTIRQPNGVLLFGDLITPDWLQAAVLKYEQSRASPQ